VSLVTVSFGTAGGRGSIIIINPRAQRQGHPGVRICLGLIEIINRSINRSINRALGVGCLGGDDAAAGRLGQESPYIILIVASGSISFVYNVGSNSDVFSWALGVWALGV